MKSQNIIKNFYDAENWHVLYDVKGQSQITVWKFTSYLKRPKL